MGNTGGAGRPDTLATTVPGPCSSYGKARDCGWVVSTREWGPGVRKIESRLVMVNRTALGHASGERWFSRPLRRPRRAASLAGLIGMALVITAAVPLPAAGQSWGISASAGAPSWAVVGTPFAASIHMSVLAGSFTSADLSAVDFYPGCTSPEHDCGAGLPHPGVYEDAAAVSATGTGVGSVGTTGCDGTWTITEGPGGHFAFSPPSTPPSVPPGGTCDVKFAVTMQQLPSTDVGGSLGLGATMKRQRNLLV